MTIHIENNEIAREKNAKRTKTLVAEICSKAYDLAIWNVTRWIRANNGKTLYVIFRLTERGLAQVGVEVSSDAIRKEVKKRGGKLLAEASPREYTAYTAPVQEIGADQESEMSPLHRTEDIEKKYPLTRNFGGRPRESTLAKKKKREDKLDACYCAITNIHISKNK